MYEDGDITFCSQVTRCIESEDVEGLRVAIESRDWWGNRLEPGQPVLHFVAWLGIHEVVKLLLKHGADVDLLDDDNDSPLMLAVASGHVEVVRLLLQHGAKLSYSIQEEQTEAERREIVRRRAEMRQRLQSDEERAKLASVLHIIEPLLARPDEEFFSPPQTIEFHAIDDCESLEVLKVLIDEFHANPNRVDSCGFWPLKRFVEDNDLEAVRWLLAHGADVDCRSLGGTALFVAVSRGNLDMMRLLIEAGANLNQTGEDLWVPLHYADTADVARQLLDHGADPTLRDQFGRPCMARTLEEMEVDELILKQSLRTSDG